MKKLLVQYSKDGNKIIYQEAGKISHDFIYSGTDASELFNVLASYSKEGYAIDFI